MKDRCMDFTPAPQSAELAARIHPGAQLAGRAAPPRADRRKRWPPSGRFPLQRTSIAIFLLPFALPLLPSSSLLSFSASARGPGRGGTAVGRDGPDAPRILFVLDPLRKLHGARGPPSDQTPFFRFCFCFSLPWKLLGLQPGLLQCRPHFGELRAYT